MGELPFAKEHSCASSVQFTVMQQKHTDTNTKGLLFVAVCLLNHFLIWDYDIPIAIAPQETMLYFMGGNVQ